MKQTPDINDFVLFLAVADAGGLAGAARATGTSVPTLSRRMTELERRTGRHLFQRGKRGYALTAEGRGLLDEAEALRPVLVRLTRWAEDDRKKARVRITAGTWTSRFLARNITKVWGTGDDWLPEFVASNAVVDIARRQADIGIRNRRPDQNWLAMQRAGRVEYAIYGVSASVQGYLSLAEPTATTPSERWLQRVHADEIVTTAGDARLALDLALAGIARIVMPCFAGDDEPGLTRLSAPISELTHATWVVSHHDARHDPPVRKALEAVHGLLRLSGGG